MIVQIQTSSYSFAGAMPVIVILVVQFLMMLLSFLYFRNKLRKAERKLNEQITQNRNVLDSQKHKLSTNLEKINKSLKTIKASQPPSELQIKPIRQDPIKPHLFAILSLPKCGGSTVTATLNHSFPNSQTSHLHVISVNEMQRYVEEAEKSNDERIKTAMMAHLNRAIETRAIIKQLGSNNTTYIAGVREPISLAISLLFEQGLNYGENHMFFSVAKIQKTIEDSEEIRWLNIRKLDRWFDENILTTSGHDVFAEPFPKDTGYKTYRGGKGDLSVYRLENFDSILGALGDVIEVPSICLEIKKENIATEKTYAEQYRTVLSEIHFSDAFIDKIYQTRYATHFYSPSEIEQFKARWRKQENVVWIQKKPVTTNNQRKNHAHSGPFDTPLPRTTVAPLCSSRSIPTKKA